MDCVMYQGSLVSVHPEVKKELNLVDFQEVIHDQLQQIIDLNCLYLFENLLAESYDMNGTGYYENNEKN